MKKILRITFAVLLLGVFIWTLWFLYKKSETKPVVFSTQTALKTNIIKKTVATGAVVPRREVNIKPQVSGIIEKLFVIAGDQVKIFNKNIPKLGLVLLIGGICIVVLSVIPVINLLVCIAYAVIYCVTLYKIYRIFAENNAVLYTVFSIIVDVTAPFFIYFASKNEPNLEIFNEGKPSNPVPPEAPSEEKIEE